MSLAPNTAPVFETPQNQPFVGLPNAMLLAGHPVVFTKHARRRFEERRPTWGSLQKLLTLVCKQGLGSCAKNPLKLKWLGIGVVVQWCAGSLIVVTCY